MATACCVGCGKGIGEKGRAPILGLPIYERPAEVVGRDENGEQKLHARAVSIAGD